MSFDVPSPPDSLPIPPRRLALIRANLGDEIERLEPARVPRWRPRVRARSRRRVVIAVALVGLLAAVGTAVGVGLGVDFLAEQQRVDRQPWTPPWSKPSGSRVEVARGPDWSFMAWTSADGVCVAYAAGAATNWGRSCGRAPEGAPVTSDYLIATLITPTNAADANAADGRGAIVGAVTPEVARIEVELADGRVLAARTQEAPRALNTDARLFLIRAPLAFIPPDAQGGRPHSPVRAYISYSSDGKRLERFPAG
jgi:hypothetical protein